MLRAILPNSSRAIPKTDAAEELFMSETRAVEDPPDEPGAEMARGARVWKTYVREADRSDKELVEGRNNSLDVLLIFAALFSAISTAFIIGSLGDLKQDPAESSAHTLLVMSQTLTAIANGQHVTLQAQEGSGTVVFSPSRSAVAVNVLWLLSLSLSVAVSLVAMLAKDWCYRFMSNRSGLIYEQARRRQEKWNGMERWKMEEVLAHLPGAMHLALLLFAAGLCVYLWDINISVAVPVIVVTTSATCVYVLATILPLADRFCPYNTPVTAALKGFQLVAYLGVNRLYMKVSRPKWLESALGQLGNWLQPAGRDPDRATTENSNVPMDVVTSQMLAWLITNCEDSRSVDTALQAIAGTNPGLPHEPLAQCGALGLAVSRLKACVKPDPKPDELTEEALSQLSVALRYSRACIALISGDSHRDRMDRWHFTTGEWKYWWGDDVYPEHTNLLKLLDQKSSDTRMLAIAAAAAMPLFHWESDQPEPGVLGKALDTVTSVLSHHSQDGGSKLSPSILQRLVEYSAHYLVSHRPGEEQHDSQVLLSIQLAHVFATSYKDAPDTARAAAITLAAAAFTCETYPGGDKPTLSDDDREKRAVSVLQYYWQRKSDEFDVFALFVFGFFGLLPRLISSAHTTQLAGITHLLKKLMDDYPFLAYSLEGNAGIRTLPEQFPLVDHVIKPTYGCISSDADDSSDKLTLALTCLLPLFRRAPVQDQRIYLTAVLALCHTKSKEHQNLCMEIVNNQWLPEAPLELLKSDNDKSLLLHLCRTLLNAHGPVVTVAALHFGLLVANIMSNEGSLSDRQSALRPLLSLGDRSSGGKEPNPLDMGVLFSHLEQSVTDRSTGTSLEYIMQSVVDFCNAGLSLNPGSDTESGDKAPDNVDWRSRLSELKDDYRPNLGNFEPAGAEGLGDLPPVPGAAEGPVASSGTTGTAKAPHEHDGNAVLEMDNVGGS